MADKNDRDQPIILILKSKNENDNYERLLHEHGYRTVFVPVLSFKFINQEALKDRLNNPEKHSGLIFTSQRAIEAVQLCLSDPVFEEKWSSLLKEQWSHLPVFVTGKATGKQVREKLNFSSVFGEDSGSAQALSITILNTLPADLNKELLFPCANIKKETLPNILKEKHYGICCITSYCTQPDPKLLDSLKIIFQTSSSTTEFSEASGLSSEFPEETSQPPAQPSCIVFFSPSGVTFAHNALQQSIKSFENVKLVAIGQSTAQEMQNLGLTVSGIPKKPDPQSLLEVIDSILD
ncbi:uroporphyrinogen-III synthase-like [Dendronephthya gigantea]|uniref:uroporphyrinogen-III synthase-like n=1 Tax=Dendronephthya gigantea TaxID=151771 RepID=UPI00106B5B75|nr:uroporphyrinogen-III synthase-like [Dendronephthya gigantea]